MRTLNLDGDRQADLSVHGGEYKAVYCYPIEHYSYWKRGVARSRSAGWRVFGENFTTSRPDRRRRSISATEFSIGSAQVVVTQPRLPCYKLGVRFQSDDMVKRFLASGRTGFYVRGQPGGRGWAPATRSPRLSRDADAVPVSEITRLYVAKTYTADDVASARRALRVTALPESWKDYFRDRLQNAAR